MFGLDKRSHTSWGSYTLTWNRQDLKCISLVNLQPELICFPESASCLEVDMWRFRSTLYLPACNEQRRIVTSIDTNKDCLPYLKIVLSNCIDSTQFSYKFFQSCITYHRSHERLLYTLYASMATSTHILTLLENCPISYVNTKMEAHMAHKALLIFGSSMVEWCQFTNVRTCQ